MTDPEVQPTTSASEGAAGTPRRIRSVSESLLSIVLGLEAALIFFVTVTAFGLKVLPAPVAWGSGAALILIFLFAARLVRHPWGVWLGWVLQAALIALGFLLPLMFFIGLGFLALWIYCFVVGRRIDARNRQRAQLAEADPTVPESTTPAPTSSDLTSSESTSSESTSSESTKESP